MYTLRCTRKLLRRLGATPSSASIAPSTVVGDWYANLLYTRPQQLVLAMNERSLLCVLVPARDTAHLGPRLRDAVSGLLLAIGVPAAVVQSEAQEMGQMAIGATASRAVKAKPKSAVEILKFPAQWPPGNTLLPEGARPKMTD